MLVTLCSLAGTMALFCMSSVALTLVPSIGLGMLGLAAAAGFGLASVGAGVGAAILALGSEGRV